MTEDNAFHEIDYKEKCHQREMTSTPGAEIPCCAPVSARPREVGDDAEPIARSLRQGLSH